MCFKYKTVIFDLDGTLLKTEEGILNALRYALGPLNISLPSRNMWRKFFGRPLAYGFQNIIGLDDEQSGQAILRFNEYYCSKGVYEACLYPGISGLLKKLKDSRLTICLATSKAPDMTEKIMAAFDLTNFIAYAEMNPDQDNKGDKKDLIRKVLIKSGSTAVDSVMVGDSQFDADGALKNATAFIGVLYGYGSKQEMQEAGAKVFARDVNDLQNLLLK